MSNTEIKEPRYHMNDLRSVFTHYDPKTGKNVPTENVILKEVNIDGRKSR